MEIFDVVDKNDIIIGQATRDECHSNINLIHRTAHFTLINKKEKKVFLTQRSFNLKTDAGKLCFPGEHLVTGEGWNDGLIRGVKEELGFTAQVFHEVCNHIFTFPSQTEFARFYIVEWNNENIKFDEDEIIKIMWLEPETLFKKSSEYSDIAKYWINNTNWDITKGLKF